ncbi:MAG: DUF4365 domain-containing protein [Gemmatimonadetes bacterium]|nr:DUF4365 domain-containing protein [Gemmatimonadota bacterium]
MAPTPDQIGRLAETIATTELAKLVQRPERVLFSPNLMGDKYPGIDLMVDILEAGGVPRGFFFVQVKGTTRGTDAAKRLPIAISRAGYNRLLEFPAPTYLVGVDVRSASSYIVAAQRPREAGVYSITRAYPLASDATRIALHGEVAAFWAANGRTHWQTRFHDR